MTSRTGMPPMPVGRAALIGARVAGVMTAHRRHAGGHGGHPAAAALSLPLLMMEPGLAPGFFYFTRYLQK
ncbi:hypothetical protein RI056_15740 [Komagataeibacter nataicola]|nr:hypothetical protein RI056_15740 [Komagataeibacter nataicola]